MQNFQNNISDLINYWLRHHPEDADIDLDEFGWAKIEDVLTALRYKGFDVKRSDIIVLNKEFHLPKWKIDLENDKIKSAHGHSILIQYERTLQMPPKYLYHGTAVQNVENIQKEGLKSMQRQYVHLAETIELAKEVGSRHGKPTIIVLETKKLLDNGWIFYKTEENVWLTKDIPTQYLSFKSIGL
ncbi:RNA 2'-phosphotransferase [Aquimarina sp. D1M17]|uniref:RNA 2'-phosphotransferase n=1 Tax=Aquimarina acroporae TaxID=2937283 RepID=UPI0020BFCDE3|nr:RNA 2'-phosphotransferase [Aquimarina acroporae]MCK8523071.1 RNA 2'-phosphotransferase [Aquimarina acroporae]